MQSWQYLRLNIDDYLLKDGQEPMSGPLDMSSNKISNLGNAQQDSDAINKSVMDTSLNLRVLKSGDTMTGPLNMSSNQINNVRDPSLNQDVATKKYVDDITSSNFVSKTGLQQMQGPLGINTYPDLPTSLAVDGLVYFSKSGTNSSGNLIIRGNSRQLDFNASSSALNLNPLVQNNDTTIIYSNGYEPDSGASLVIGPLTSTGSGGIRMNSVGDVGIGTATPTQKLHVNGSALVENNASENQFTINTGSGAKGRKANERFYSTFASSSSGDDTGSRRTADIVAGFNSTSYTGGVNGVWGSEYLSLNVGNNGNDNDGQLLTSEKVRITASGNVGIGTTTPVQKLHVNGSALIANNLGIGITSPTQALDVNGSAIVRTDLGVNGGATITGNVGAGNFRSGIAATINSQGAWIDWNSNPGKGRTAIMNQKGTPIGGGGGGIEFGESTTGNVRTVNMFLDGSGNLGIGISSPTQKLDVNGNANITGSVTSNTQFYMGNANSTQRDRLLIADNSGGFLYYNEEGSLGRFVPGTVKWQINKDGVITINNNSGSSGQVLTSQGSNSSPIWT